MNLPSDNIVANPTPELTQDFTLINAYIGMMVSVQHVPYFMHYFRSSNPVAQPGKQLPAVIAERIVKLAPRWDTQMVIPGSDYEDSLGNAIQLLTTLCTIFFKENLDSVIPKTTRTALQPWLRKWTNQGEFLRTVSVRLVDIFSNPFFQSDVQSFRRMLKNWDTCALPGCGSKKDLKVCSR